MFYTWINTKKRQKIIFTLCTFQLFWKSFVTGTQFDFCRNFHIIFCWFHTNFTTPTWMWMKTMYHDVISVVHVKYKQYSHQLDWAEGLHCKLPTAEQGAALTPWGSVPMGGRGAWRVLSVLTSPSASWLPTQSTSQRRSPKEGVRKCHKWISLEACGGRNILFGSGHLCRKSSGKPQATSSLQGAVK